MILPDVLAPTRPKPSVGAVHWFVDASNVIGSRPDGWWRDRPGATRRLIDAVQAWASAEDARVTVVLDAGPPELARAGGPVDVVIAPRRGRDAADDEIARLIQRRRDARVVTSDAALAARARAAGAQVEGAGSFRDRLAY
jgi:predicted RNA-binding protein with PIN domain